MVTSRRAFLLGGLAALAAPAVIRTPGLLMPIKPVLVDPHVIWLSRSDTYREFVVPREWAKPIIVEVSNDGRSFRPIHTIDPRDRDLTVKVGSADQYVRMVVGAT